MTVTKPKIEVKRDGVYPVVLVDVDEPEQVLVGVADLHAGHPNFEEATFKRVLKYIQTTGALWFGNGDLMENANKRSVGAGWVEQIMRPQEQIEYVTELLLPIKDSCIGMTLGNHEERTYKDTGIDPMSIICNNLEVPYVGYELFAKIRRRYGKDSSGIAFTLYAVHSNVSNKTPGLAMHYMSREWAKFLDFDLIAKGHGHDMGISPPEISYTFDMRNNSVIERERRYWMTGHYLGRVNSYVAKKPSPPKPTGTIAARLKMDKNTRMILAEEVR